MSAALMSFVPPRPAYRSPVGFLAAMGAIGVTAILTRADGSVRLDFHVPTHRMHRAEVLTGDRETWSISFWEACTAMAVTLLPSGRFILKTANDEAHLVDLATIGAPVVSTSAPLPLHLADLDTPEALLRALAAVGGLVVLRRDEDGLGLGFAAPGRREVRLDALLSSCGAHDGDWWIGAVATLWRVFPDMGSPWEMEIGEVRRLRLSETVDHEATPHPRILPRAASGTDGTDAFSP